MSYAWIMCGLMLNTTCMTLLFALHFETILKTYMEECATLQKHVQKKSESLLVD